MTKTKDAFALRDFDSKRILARKFFSKIFNPGVADENLIAIMCYEESYDDKDFLEHFEIVMFPEDDFFKYQQILEEVYDCLKQYFERIAEHYTKIDNFSKNVAMKIAGDTNSAEKYKNIFERSVNLNERYLEILNDVGNLQLLAAGISGNNKKAFEKYCKIVFGQNLKAARIKAGLTQQQLGDLIRIAKPDISRFENGNKVPAYFSLLRLASALNCTLDDLAYRHKN